MAAKHFLLLIQQFRDMNIKSVNDVKFTLTNVV